MRDQNGMIRYGLIQVFEDKHSSFQRFRVVVLETEDPLSRRGLGRPLAKSLLNRFDGPQIPIHVPQVRTAGGSRVRVGINESRQNGFSTQRSEEHTSELQSPCNLVCRLLLEKKKIKRIVNHI